MVEQPADLVILAAFTFNNVRLLLLSGIGEPYDPIAGRGVVGRNYAYQPWGKVQLFFEDKVFKRYMGGGGIGTVIDDFVADNFDHSGLGFMGGAEIGVQSSGALPIRSHPVPSGTPRWGGHWKQAVARYYDSSLQIGVNIGCQSYRGYYLDLDPTYRDARGLPLLRMTYNWHDNERRIAAYATKKAAEIGKAMNASKMNVNFVPEKYTITGYQSTHNLGGAAMGKDPSVSVVNKYLQSWDVPNVFVVGGSAFPETGAHGPTPTIGALACWTADAIKEQYLKRPGALA
jgi:gluconate 2-dehydrogenase alpha chain